MSSRGSPWLYYHFTPVVDPRISPVGLLFPGTLVTWIYQKGHKGWGVTSSNNPEAVSVANSYQTGDRVGWFDCPCFSPVPKTSWFPTS
ncbi:hypothetical protein ES705_19949 [subsurface metagenome]